MDEKDSGGGYKDAFLIIGVFILLFFVWVATGGPQNPSASAGLFIKAPKPIGGGTENSNPTFGYRVPQSLLPQAPTARPVDPSAVDERKKQTDPDQGTLERSTYRGIVSFSRTTAGARNSSPQTEYVRISVSSRAEEPVSITGWMLGSAVTEKRVSIPLGSNLPLSGLVTDQEPIVLNPGDTAYILSGRSPIGSSFRINQCIGYFTQYQNFTPSISRSCPLPVKELQTFSGINLDRQPSCEEFAEDIPRCSIPTSLPSHLSFSCRAFLENNVHYNGCVRNHQNDLNFFKNEWRVYLGRSGELWKQERETIRLYDASGNLVDQLSY